MPKEQKILTETSWATAGGNIRKPTAIMIGPHLIVMIRKLLLPFHQLLKKGETIHIICEVKDVGTPQLTRYQRLVIKIE